MRFGFNSSWDLPNNMSRVSCLPQSKKRNWITNAKWNQTKLKKKRKNRIVFFFFELFLYILHDVIFLHLLCEFVSTSFTLFSIIPYFQKFFFIYFLNSIVLFDFHSDRAAVWKVHLGTCFRNKGSCLWPEVSLFFWIFIICCFFRLETCCETGTVFFAWTFIKSWIDWYMVCV